MMFFQFIVLIIVLCGNFKEVSTHCVNSQAGKTTCVTRDLLEMLVGLGHCKESKDKPMFHAFLKNTLHFTGSNTLNFDEVITNVGDHYKSGVFKAPRKGIYQFTCLILAALNNSITYQVSINNNLFIRGYTSKTSHANSSTNTWIVQLDKGDRVYIRHRGNHSGDKVLGNRHSYFNGLLLQYTK